jgi:hypothetical protein
MRELENPKIAPLVVPGWVGRSQTPGSGVQVDRLRWRLSLPQAKSQGRKRRNGAQFFENRS